ncbi:hypothetical protein F5Y18DRAFT_439753 [Xylariaceae sp. FL1019]|nr:hypothetical protein F5Y18DRAFT_439753 [Xylariaceae sp. FL1019]
MTDIQAKGFDLIPREIIHRTVSKLGPLDRINLALSSPRLFLSENYNIWDMEAHDQASAQEEIDSSLGKSRSYRFAERLHVEPTRVPLIYAAIKNNVAVSVIRDMVHAYKPVCGNSIVSGFWGIHPSKNPPPLITAGEAGRLDVVTLLLDEGADPNTLYGSNHVACSHSDLTHNWCHPPRGVGQRHHCRTVLNHILHSPIIKSLPPGCPAHEVTQDIAILLWKHGARLTLGTLGPAFERQNPRGIERQLIASELHRRLRWAIKLNMPRLVQLIYEEDEEISLLRTREHFHPQLLFSCAVLTIQKQKASDSLATLQYLIQVGAPLVSSLLIPSRGGASTYLLEWASAQGHHQTVAYLLECHVEMDVPIHWESLRGKEDLNQHRIESCPSKSSLLPLFLVKMLYEGLATLRFSRWYPGKTNDDLHNDLLTHHMLKDRGAPEISPWLVAQGVGNARHLAIAMTKRRFFLVPGITKNIVSRRTKRLCSAW